ncbi:MAG: S8 family serine peptidase [Verrucomicrobia bacterium]|nr:S8 family serine peptidase [Verrucomicrobiota bacterium]
MRLESRTWFLLSLLLFTAALFFWLFGNDYQSRKGSPAQPAQKPAASGRRSSALPGQSVWFKFPLLTRLDTSATQYAQPKSAIPENTSAHAPTSTQNAKSGYRLSNTVTPVRTLARVETALLLRNAFIDTAQPVNLPVPEHLRSAGDPGSYLVQARGPIRENFRARLREADASVISYIPNNTYLVRVSAAGAARLQATREVNAILPYEPYYKLDPKLLALAVEQKPLPSDQPLRLTLFPGEREAALREVLALGGELVEEEPSPFGPQLVVRANPDSLSALAHLPSVQGIEPCYERRLMNDRARVRVGLATNSVTPVNHLGLTGSNIVVNLNDSGVDATHPDLAGRVIGSEPRILADEVGHGTHVAGIIAGNGSQSATVPTIPDGSVTNANFRGMAPRARIFALPLVYAPTVNSAISDTYLQETAAASNTLVFRRRSTLISNNSWNYNGANEYDSSAARFDAATRDALPKVTNAQPVLYVVSGGNTGEGEDDGLSGLSSSVPSPATAKNIIAVGALESLRIITNAGIVTNMDMTLSTNQAFLAATDSDDQVAAFSSRGNVEIGTEGEFGRFKPDVVAPGGFLISTRSKDWKFGGGTNAAENQVIEQANATLGRYYRYESGTSMSAPVVSGLLALLQEFFEQRLPVNLRRTNSPALLKAMILHGARSAGSLYDVYPRGSINFQGWGLVNISNTLPAILASTPESSWPIRFFDQNPTNAVGTGQTRSWNLDLSTNAQQVPLRMTLVWTDPPGNPNAGIKLVNDLDLVLSNTVTHQVFYGNNIPTASDFTQPTEVEGSPLTDIVNNVENIFIRDPFASNFVVSVVGRRVNVAAVSDYQAATKQDADIVQDFAMVVSSGDFSLTNAFTITPMTNSPPVPRPSPIAMTNGVPLLKQRVGAQPTLVEARDGVPEQWNFFVFTNSFMTNNALSLTNGTNVAFITFLPPDIGRPRNFEADIDLYVSKDPALTNLTVAALDSAWRSVSRGGTESVVFTNAALGDIFYIGVKSEDQQASEYGLIAFSSDQPFETLDNGSPVLRAFPIPAEVPDGVANNPGGVQLFAVGLTPSVIERVVVTMAIAHEDLGDLIGILSHEGNSSVLNNHTLNEGFFSGTNVFIYDDSTFRPVLFSQRTDGPGSLNNFAGQTGSGVWMLNMVDNSPTHTGRVAALTIRIQPLFGGDLGAAGPAGLNGTVGPNDRTCFFHDVPPEATNLIVRVSQLTGPVELMIRREKVPDTNQFDKTLPISPPGGELTLDLDDEPFPLKAGRYTICLFNPSLTATVNFHISSVAELGLLTDSSLTSTTTNVLALIDDGLVTSSFDVRADKEVFDAQVGVRINHSRPQDLALHLVSPQGTRVLLAENRGGFGTQGYGAGYDTNLSYTVFTEQTNRFTNLLTLKFSTPPFTNALGSGSGTPIFFDGFENAKPGQFSSNEVLSGWTVSQGKVQLHTTANPLGILPAEGTNFLELDTARSPAGVLRSFNTDPGSRYLLNFKYNRNPAAIRPGVAHALQIYYGPPSDLRPPQKFIPAQGFGWTSTDIVFQATSPVTMVELASLTSAGPLVDDVQVTDVVATTNNYVLPEEAMKVLRGERTLGEWRLEVRDTRREPGGGLPALLSWQLFLRYTEPSVKAIFLTNGLSYSGILTNNQTNYFIVELCETATEAFATLTGATNKLVLLADRSGIPLGEVSRDDFTAVTNSLAIDAANGTGTFGWKLDPKHPAPIQPGQRFYLAVHGLEPDTTNNYSLRLDIDHDECHGDRPVVTLASGIPYTNTIPSIRRDFFDYYRFTTSCNAESVDFELTPSNGDLGLLLKKGAPPPLPDLTHFDYQVDLDGITNEFINLTTNSTPVALLPGEDWYLAVFTKATNPIVYTVKATEHSTTGTRIAGTNVVVLTNAVPLDFTIKYCPDLSNYFRFTITNPVAAVKFDVYNVTYDADLFVGHNSLPTPASFFSSNSIVDVSLVQTVIRTNAQKPSLAGDWYLFLTNRLPTSISFTVQAEVIEEAPPEGVVYIDPKLQIGLTNICLSWGALIGVQYQVEAKARIEDPSWVAISPVLVASSKDGQFCVDLPTDYRFFRVVQFPLTPPPPPPPPSQFITPGLIISQTNLCLRWASVAGTNYVVQARTNIEDRVWDRLSSVISATGTNSEYCVSLPTPYRFFQIEVIGGAPPLPPPPPPPPPSQFITPGLTISPTNLCLRWASVAGTNYVVQARTNIEDRVWDQLSSVITAAGTNSEYCVSLPTPYRFFQIGVVGGAPPPPPPPPSQFITPGLTVTATNLCLRWASVAGTNYLVAAKTNIEDRVWDRLSSVLTATGTNTEYCIAMPTTYRFFQIEVVGGAPPPPPPSQPVVVALAASPTNLCVRWNSIVGTNYVVQAKTNLEDQVWVRLSSVITAGGTNSELCVSLPMPYRFFRVAVAGAAPSPAPPPASSAFINPELVVSKTNLCLRWPSLIGTNYVVEAKTNIEDTVWGRISSVITATSTNSEHCLAFPISYQFFRVAVVGRVTLSGFSRPAGRRAIGLSSPSSVIEPDVRYSATNVCLYWNSQVGTQYRIEGTTAGPSRMIYDNTPISGNPRSYFAGNGIEFGDDIVLTGTERLLTDFRFDYYLSPNANLNEKAELFFRLNDGPDETPGTIIFRSGEFPLDTSPSGHMILEAVDMGLPVPATFAWSVVITGIDLGEQVGLILNGPPAVGESLVSFWLKTREGAWVRNLIDSGAEEGSFSASVKAASTTGVNWKPVATVTASAANSSHCLDLTNPYRLFRILPGQGEPGPEAPRLNLPAVLADGRLQFSWSAAAGKRYELQWSPNIASPPETAWVTLTNVTSAGTTVTVTEPSRLTNSVRFYRLRAQ